MGPPPRVQGSSLRRHPGNVLCSPHACQRFNCLFSKPGFTWRCCMALSNSAAWERVVISRILPNTTWELLFSLIFFFPGSCLSYLPDLILAVDLADLPTWFKSGAASLLWIQTSLVEQPGLTATWQVFWSHADLRTDKHTCSPAAAAQLCVLVCRRAEV